MQSISNYQDLSALELVPAAVWVFDIESHSIWWGNRAAIEFWRAESLDDLRARDFSTDSHIVRRRLRDYFTDTPPGAFSSEFWTLYPRGTPFQVHLHFTPLRIESQRAALLIHLVAGNENRAVDDNERRLVEASRYSRTIVRTFSEDGRMLSQNPAAASVFRGVHGDARDVSLASMFVDPEMAERIVADCAAQRFEWHEVLVHTAEGQCWYRLDVQPSIDPVTGLPAIIISGEDISETHTLLQRLEAINAALERRVEERTSALEEALEIATLARAEAEDANRAKSTFLAQMSHDLRTPLNAIMGMTDVMRSEIFGPLSDHYRSYSEDVHGAATHLLALINDLLDLSKIEAGALEPNLGSFDVTELMGEARDLALKSGKGGCNTINLSLTGESSFNSDRRMIYQILVNLLSNARRFTPVDGRIDVAVENHDGVMRLTVSDTGTGIAADKLAQILQPYRQGDPVTADPNEGTGLGLAIVNGLSRILGGDTEIFSTPGEGTQVIVTLREEGRTDESNIVAFGDAV